MGVEELQTDEIEERSVPVPLQGKIVGPKLEVWHPGPNGGRGSGTLAARRVGKAVRYGGDAADDVAEVEERGQSVGGPGGKAWRQVNQEYETVSAAEKRSLHVNSHRGGRSHAHGHRRGG